MPGKKIGEIDHCDRQLKFQCPQRWTNLIPTDEPSTKICEVCLKQIYLCENNGDVTRHARQWHCVAVFREEEDESECWLGAIDFE